MLKLKIVILLLLLVSIAFKGKDTLTPYTFPELLLFPKMPLPETNPVTKEGAELGKYLFYDPILSADSSISCSSCHKQKYAFSDAGNAFSKGNKEHLMSRNTLPLFNLAWYPSLFWDGKAASIEEQVFHPVREHNEMNLKWNDAAARIKKNKFYVSKFLSAFGRQEIDSILISKAIAQFERTLLSYRSKYDRVIKGEVKFTEEEKEGFVLMNDMTKGDCLHCHTTDANPLGTTLKFSNNGLDAILNAKDYKDKGRGSVTGDEKDNGKFKIPSLRNIALTAPYMHDGRFTTLEEVVDFYSEGINKSATIDSKMGAAHQKGVHLSAEEKHKLISFLKTLTDSAFITDPEFGNPFLKN